jgi:hypothetical protein
MFPQNQNVKQNSLKTNDFEEELCSGKGGASSGP